MASERGIVEIVLDRPRKLKFDLNAMAELENVAGGRSIAELFDPDRKPGLDILRKLLWAGLLHEDPSLGRNSEAGVRRVGRLIEEHAQGKTLIEKVSYVSQKIGEATTIMWGTGDGAENPPPAAPGAQPTKVESPGTGQPPSA